MVATTLYACISAALLVFLAVQVIKQRRQHQVALGDGDIDTLRQARSAHANATEYLPILLILLFLLETNGAPALLVHLCGIVMLSGRIVHAHAILQSKLKLRVLGMVITFATIAVLILLNLLALTGIFQ